VILLTLLVQGLSMPAVVRWARLPEDVDVQDEQALVEREATLAGLAAVDVRAAQLLSPPEVVDRVRTAYQSRLARLEARGEAGAEQDEQDEQDEQAEDRLRLALLADKRAAVVRLRDGRRIDDTVLRWVQARLDVEEVRLATPGPSE